MSRTTEFVLGLIGAILGFLGAIMAIAFGGLDTAISGSTSIATTGWIAFFMSIVGLVGAIIVRNKPKAGGILMLIAAVVGVICIFVFYLVPGILMFIGGLMGLIKKDKQTSVS